MTIEITGATKEETAYDKWIHFTYEAEEYHALLHWDSTSGFDLTFTDARHTNKWVKTPNWAIEWNKDTESNYEDTLEFTLDSLTDEVIEASY
jgi:hypothetical protein